MTSNRSYEIEVFVYSAFTARAEDLPNRLEAYLYDHTKHTSVDYPDGSLVHGILVTSVSAVIDPEASPYEVARDNPTEVLGVADVLKRARFLAQYQNDRLASGSISATIYGSQAEAEGACFDRCRRDLVPPARS